MSRGLTGEAALTAARVVALVATLSVLFIGEVQRCEHHTDRTPLLYHAGHMHAHGLL